MHKFDPPCVARCESDEIKLKNSAVYAVDLMCVIIAVDLMCVIIVVDLMCVIIAVTILCMWST